MEATDHNQKIILAPVQHMPRTNYLVWSALLAVLLGGVAAWIWQLNEGLGITGLNRPVYWGVYITNFVFFIGLAHSGTFISAILRIAGQSWRAPLTRAAEAITVFSLPFGVISIIIDMGHPERIFNLVFFGRFQSPILWDVTAVGLYMLASFVFFYLSLIPDLAICRDSLADIPRWQRRMYKVLAFGWDHRPEQYRRLDKVLDGMAIFMTILVVTVHTVVAWLFGMTVQPGWHTALLGPFFLLGAILSGIAAVVITLSILRKSYHLEAVLPVRLFNSLRKLLITFVLGWLYLMIAEYLTTGYGSLTGEMAVLKEKFTGSYALVFWGMTCLVFIFPLLIFIYKGKNHIGWMVAGSVLINVGMWLERYIVIVPTEISPRMVNGMGPGSYLPALPEIAITAACFAGLVLLYAVFTRFFPIIPIWGTEQGLTVNKLSPQDSPIPEEAESD